MATCKNCGKEKDIQSRGMCYQCYVAWLNAGKPPMRFDTRTSAEKFDKDCENGTVLGLLASGMPQYEIARSYGVTDMTARKYMQKHKIIPIRHRRFAKAETLVYDPAKLIALARPWVKNETPRYYFPV